jgi:hypothetical protein
LNVTNLADGLAKFVVERAKTELNIAFFDKFKRELEDQEDLRKLFPQTYQVLRAIDKEIYNYEVYLESLRSAFQKDLRNIFTNLSRFLQDPQQQGKFNGSIAAKIIVELLPIADMVINGRHPSEIISFLATDFRVKEPNVFIKNLANTFKFSNLISQSLISKDDIVSNRWIGIDEFSLLFSRKYPHAFRLYIGLLYQQGDSIWFYHEQGSTTFRKVLSKIDSIDSNLKKIRTPIEIFYNQAKLVDNSLNMISKFPKDSLSYDQYYQFTQATIGFIEAAGYHIKSVADDIVTNNNKNDLKERDDFFSVLNLLSDLNLDLKMKNYHSAIVNTVAILNLVIEKDSLKVFETQLIKYGSFMATVSNAGNSDEVKKAIETVALPPGSASMKKRTKFNAAINTYFGGFYARENLRLEDNKGKVYGITTPLGISASIPFRVSCISKIPIIKYIPPFLFFKGEGSLTIFGSIIDIGAITAYRVTDKNDSTTTQNLPEVKLKNIIAPGLYAIYGFPNVPLSLGVGWQTAAELRNIVAETEGEEPTLQLVPSSGYRFLVFLAVDIPLFNLYTKPR